MITGILLVAGVGLLWMVIGIAMSRAARNGTDFIAFLTICYVATLLLTLVFYVDWGVTLSCGVKSPGSLFATAFGGGFINVIGLLLLQRAMSLGHNGSAWAIGQSSLIIPFLLGVLVFHEHLGIFELSGVTLLVIGILLPSFSSQGGEVGRGWLLYTLAAFLLLGVSMAIINAPSYWKGWSDSGQLRPSLINLGGTFALLLFCLWKRTGVFRLGRREIAFAAGLAVLNAVNIKVLLLGLDLLAAAGAGSIGYPISIGACIAGFSLYSLLLLRERGHWQNWTGLSATMAGIAFLAFK